MENNQFQPSKKMTGIEQYFQYKENGGEMSFTEWYKDGRYNKSLDPSYDVTPNPHGDNDFATPDHLKIA